MRRFHATAIAAAIGLASASSASATKLTFDGDICGGLACTNWAYIDADYGSSATVAVSYYHDVTNSSPGDQLQWWGTGYSDLPNAAFGGTSDSSGEPAITLAPLLGTSITLNSFDLAPYEGSRQTQVTIFVNGIVAYSTGFFTLGATETFTPDITSTSPISIEWGPDGYNVGIDNLTFNGVPEASTWAMMGLGFAGLGLVGYRARRASVAISL